MSGTIVFAQADTPTAPSAGQTALSFPATSLNQLKFVDGDGATNIIEFPTAGGTLTIPTGGGTIVTLTGTQTLTNKTLTSPTLTTPTLGVATATTINKVILTQPATGSTLTIADGKTLTASNSLTLAGTDGKSLTLTGSLTVPADGTAALLETENVFEANQQLNSGSRLQMYTSGELYQSSGVLYLEGISNVAFSCDSDNIGSANYFRWMTDGAGGSGTELARLKDNGHFLIGTTTDSGQLTVNQSSSTAAQPVLHLTQADLSEGFVDYVGTSAASSTGPISTWTTGNTVQGHFAVEINGTRRWVRYYDNPTS